jgi:hypothetical protein
VATRTKLKYTFFMANEIDFEKESSTTIVAKDNGGVVGRLTADDNGNEVSIWVDDRYNTVKTAIESGLRKKARELRMLA